MESPAWTYLVTPDAQAVTTWLAALEAEGPVRGAVALLAEASAAAMPEIRRVLEGRGVVVLAAVCPELALGDRIERSGALLLAFASGAVQAFGAGPPQPKTGLATETPLGLQTGAPEAAPAIRLQALTSVIGEDEPGELLRLLDVFSASARGLMAQAVRAQQALDTMALSQAMHKIKASALTIGASELAEQGQAIELAAKRSDWSELELLLPALDARIGTVLAAIRGLLVDQMAPSPARRKRPRASRRTRAWRS